jgi:hypothetical protein
MKSIETIKWLFFFTLLLQHYAYSQSVYVSRDNNVYSFLERLNLGGMIQLNDEVKPFTRKYIAEKLLSAFDNKDQLNEIEKQLLSFFAAEYKYEIEKLAAESDNSRTNKFPAEQIKERWFLFSHSDSLFNLKISPIAGYEISATGKNSGHSRWWGASVFASYDDWFAASMSLSDRGEFGDNADASKFLTPKTGAWYKSAPNGIEYTDVKGSISFDWNWGSISLIKDYFSWGHGSFGNLIFSDKAPSYPRINFELKPVKWLRFYYVHGWLNSQVLDSSAFYYSYPSGSEPRLRKRYINKYVAANLITAAPVDWLDVSIGNSIVYSGSLRPEFFIPFMFFKFLDHNSGRGDIDDGNGQMYLDLSVKYPEEFHFYSSLFIDVTEIRNILSNNFNNTWIGFTFGGKKKDLLAENLDITVEYTRVNPWVYEHKDETTTYKHLNFPLGHWLGQNADLLQVRLDYSFIRGLYLSFFVERVRKGGLDDISSAYNVETNEPFLYSPVRKDYRLGLSCSYEFFHDLIFRGYYEYSSISDESLERTPDFQLGKKNNFSLSVHYGL